MNKFFRTCVGVLTVLMFTLTVFVNSSFAQNELMFGQHHYYSVTFRGNGEAVVYAKMAVTNPDSKPLTEFSFEVPGVIPTDMTVYQMYLPPVCVDGYSNNLTVPCSKYQDADYEQQYYYYGYNNRGGKVEYQKVAFTKSGNRYTFTLPTPIEPNKSTAFIVAYSAKGYVHENVGLYSFNFETLKVASRIEEVRVTADVDSDLLLKGSPSRVNYGDSLGLSSARDASAPTSMSNRSLDNVVQKIGSYGALTKTAKNLSPQESLLVTGEYARSWFRLYLSSLLMTLVVIGGIIGGIYFFARASHKRKNLNSQINVQITQPVTMVVPQSASPLSIVNLTHSLTSLGAVAGVIGLTYALRFLTESNLLRSIGRDPVVPIVIMITIVMLYVLLIIGPAVLLAIKHGWKSFLIILVAEFLWFIVFIIIYLSLFQTVLR